MADDVRLLEDHDGREILFVGKVADYSAGATFMAAFPVARRFLTRHTRLMIHERSIHKEVALNGSLRMVVASIKAALHEVGHSILIEEEVSATCPGQRRRVRGIAREGTVQLVS